ncbi:MAG: restriction endonuclease [Pseudomonadota bacterium]
MTAELASQGSLFSADFLQDSIRDMAEWSAIDDAQLAELKSALEAIVEAFPTDQTPNESQTEDDLIWPVLEALGWTSSLRQQNLSARGRDDVPDGLLFENDERKAHANTFPEEWKRYEFGLAVVESKRWLRPLDRRSGRRGEELAPSTQMLRYLRRVDDLTSGALRWGILTNGSRWRLYYQGARSVSEQFFELDLATILDLPGHNEGLFSLDDEARAHWLKVFALVFSREAFIPAGPDPRTFHQRALEEGRFYEQRVADNLSKLVFDKVYPDLVKALASSSAESPLQEVREAALILLYRLLFILYAEDRDLLPVRDTRYDDYGLRERVRLDIGDRKDREDVFSDTASRYWAAISDLFHAIDQGDSSIGLPPYNGGLFDPDRTPLLENIRISDAAMADIIDALSFERTDDGRKYINYRSLSVQQLGSIYERLLEYEAIYYDDELVIRPNIFARKGSGSYYTPDDLVRLIINESVEPLVQERMKEFVDKLDELNQGNLAADRKLGNLKRLDPAEKLLDLKVCDPAMGSGHFLVSLVDYLADQVIAAMAEAPIFVPEEWGDYISPLAERIDAIRNTILANAEERNWTIDEEQLDDRHIIRRMVLKRCIYGVDKNPMAVELAKVSLWLHTFTVGAPLSFLDHHLRCGDSLFGSWVKVGIDKATTYGSPLLLHDHIRRAVRAASKMQIVEGLTDAEIAEAHRSADVFAEIEEMTAPLSALLSFIHALDWMNFRDKATKDAVKTFFDGQYGDPLTIAMGDRDPAQPPAREGTEKSQKFARGQFELFVELLANCRELIAEERFLNWQVAFPGIWSDWEDEQLSGGFDAVIGNPPWDRMKFQQVEWFAERRPEIALAPRAADRKRMVAELAEANDPLSLDYEKAAARAEAAVKMARSSGDYPLLSGGDLNIYSLFVERGMTLLKPDGMLGLLTPSGIASDKTASNFFKSVATCGRLKALYDFENGRQRTDYPPFFPDVHRSFKFCAFIASPSETAESAKCAFFLHDVSEITNPERCFPLSAEDFARVNPNTGTAPILKSRRDAELTTAIYGRLPVLVDHSTVEETKVWPVRYLRMLDMTNDSHLFRTREELDEREGGYPTGGNHFGSANGEWVPLYVGRMIHQFDHRAASVEVNTENVHNAAFSGDISSEQKANPEFLPTPQFWVSEQEINFPERLEWAIAFRDIARATDVRTMIAAIVPKVGLGNTAPLLVPEQPEQFKQKGDLLLANLNALVFDYVTRQKTQSTHLNWYIVEQLPVVPPEHYENIAFGTKSSEEVVRQIVLELTYTAHDMAPFARDMDYLDEAGDLKPPFIWNEERRLGLRAKLDAIFFHLYGINERDDVRYVYSTFPIIEREEMAKYGMYRSCELCLAYMNALAAGNPDAEIDL